MKTLIAHGHREFAGQVFPNDSEIPGGVLPKEIVVKWLDWRWCVEVDDTERRSLHRIFSPFSGSEHTTSLDRELMHYSL